MAAELETRGQCVVVTGAANGIGRSLALQLAREGANLALADINAQGLEDTRKQIEALGVNVMAQKVDMAEFGEVDAFARAVFAWADAPVRIVYANAGIHGLGSAIDPDLKAWDTVLGVNLMGPVHMAKAFVPRLIAQDEDAQFVITASQASFLAAPGMSPYVSAKHALWGYADCLRMELAMAKSKVGASIVGPSRTLTGITSPRYEEMKSTEGDEAAEAYKAMMIGPDPIAAVMLREAKKRAFWIIPSHESTMEAFKSRAQEIVDSMPAGMVEA